MVIKTPEWVKNAIFYQIYPDTFARKVPDRQKWLLDVPLEDWEAPQPPKDTKEATSGV